MYFEELREEYESEPLREEDLREDPIDQLRDWLDRAAEVGLPLANGMTLATADQDGRPSARVVLLKELDARGLAFFTHYASRKGRDLAVNPRAALLFWWAPLHRQVRVEGKVERLSGAESDAYFQTRPRESNLSALASPQSEVVGGRGDLEQRIERTRKDWEGRELERPESWGGYRLVPDEIEFFQGRRDRVHDRLRYRRSAEGWLIERLAP